MEEKGLLFNVGKGVLRSTIITIILVVILSAIMYTVEVGTQFISVALLMITCLSVVYGAIYASRKNNRNGWVVGLMVAFLYMLVMYIVQAVFFKDASLSTGDFWRLVIAAFVGILSGMLGINL